MPKLVPNPPPGFDHLSIDEQIEYLQSLWDRIAATPGQVPVPEWHAEMAERHRKLGSTPDKGRPWEDVRQDIERRLHDSSSE